jgi:hypothetical protein
MLMRLLDQSGTAARKARRRTQPAPGMLASVFEAGVHRAIGTRFFSVVKPTSSGISKPG